MRHNDDDYKPDYFGNRIAGSLVAGVVLVIIIALLYWLGVIDPPPLPK